MVQVIFLQLFSIKVDKKHLYQIVEYYTQISI